MIYLGIPTYDGTIQIDTTWAILQAIHPSDRTSLRPVSKSGSLLGHTFNKLWCEALNLRSECQIKYFAMIHSDVIVETKGWLSILRDELEKYDADIMSTIIPIKDDRNVTSAAIASKEGKFKKYISLFDTKHYPETFTAAGIGYENDVLWVNTGCWICRFDRPWVEDFDTFKFQVDSWIEKREGRYVANVLSEDWRFSQKAYEAGLKVMATQKIRVFHVGKAGFSNAPLERTQPLNCVMEQDPCLAQPD